MKSSIKILLSILLLFVAPQVFAGPFDPPPTDQSVNLLGVIFGDSIGNIYLGGRANPVLSSLMEKFNFIMVVVGIVVVSYVAVLSTINTAQEGSVMGKRWSAIWIPMRSVAGMALMVPAPASGYSMIQVTVMWIIIQGIGAADTLWNIALDGLSSGVSATAGTMSNDPLLDPTNSTVQALVQQVLNATVCMQSLYAQASLPANVDANTWVSQYGQYIKNFSIQNSAPVVVSGTIGNAQTQGNRSATVSGYSYFGVNDTNDPDAMTICGRFEVVGSVSEQGDFGLTSYTIPDADLIEMAQLIYDTKIKAISSMVFVLNPLAEGLVSGQYSTEKYAADTNSRPASPNPPPGGYRLAAANAYVLGMKSLVVPLSAKYGAIAGLENVDSAQSLGQNIQATGEALLNTTDVTDTSAQTQAVIAAGKTAGWVTAGSFYFVFNKAFTGTLFESAIPTKDPIASKEASDAIPSCDTTNCMTAILDNSGSGSSQTTIAAMQNKEIISNEVLDQLAKNLANSAYFLKSDNVGMPTSLNFPTPGADSGPVSQVMGAFNSSGAQIIRLMSDVMSSIGEGEGGDPLLAHALFGRYIMLIIEGSFLAIIALILVTVAGSIIPFAGPFFATLTLLLIGLVAILSPLFGVLWTLGAMLSIYCPLIPYMIFTMGVVGWLLTVIEAIVAAPIIALGLVMPAGDEMGKVGAALTILANIFLRPMLMIFGFLLASNLFRAVIQLIDYGMADVFKTIAVGTIFSVIVVLFVYVTFIVSVTNICFSLIYAIPDKILRWIGGHGESTNVGNLDEVKSKAQGVSSEVGGGIKETGGKIGSKAVEGGKLIMSKGASAKGGGASGGASGGAAKGGAGKTPPTTK